MLPEAQKFRSRRDEVAAVYNIYAWRREYRWAVGELEKARNYLSFLHRKTGTIIPTYDADEITDLEDFLRKTTGETYVVDWEEGAALSQETGRILKLGKLLGKISKRDSQNAPVCTSWRKKLEGRELPFKYEIRTDISSVLNMSTDKCWSSCTALGEDNSSYAVNEACGGTAVMYFYRGEAKEPCGRVLLRPTMNDCMKPTIQVLRTVYGNGPEAEMIRNEVDDILALTGRNIETSWELGPIHPHDIYDDNQGGEVEGAGEEGEVIMDMVWGDILIP